MHPGDGVGIIAGPHWNQMPELPPIAALRPDFIWGVSTSSFQIEGATREDGRGPSIWDTRCQRGEIANHDTGDIACDHYHRYNEDIGLMQGLGVQAYRFSVAWPRVLPQGRGTPNELGLAFYDRLIDAILAAGIEPWLCLYHWDMPQALDDLGSWTTRDSVGWFTNYTALVAARYGDRVKRFATFNEPSIFTLFGFGFGGGERGQDAPGHSSREPQPWRGGRRRARPRVGQFDWRHPQLSALLAVNAGGCAGGRQLRHVLESGLSRSAMPRRLSASYAGGDGAAHADRRPCAHSAPGRLVRSQPL